MVNKDTEINPFNVFLRGKKVYTQLSTKVSDLWGFDNPTLYPLAAIDGTTRFYKIPVPFGLVESKQADPSKYSLRGEAGDIVSVDKNFQLTLIRKQKFLSLYPKIENR